MNDHSLYTGKIDNGSQCMQRKSSCLFVVVSFIFNMAEDLSKKNIENKSNKLQLGSPTWYRFTNMCGLSLPILLHHPDAHL